MAKVGSLEDKDLIQQVLDEINPYIRYCEYNMNALGDGQDDADMLQSLREDAGNSLLEAKIESMLSEAAKKQAETFGEISWRGETIPVRNEQVGLCRAIELTAVASNCAAPSEGIDHSPRNDAQGRH